MTFQHPFKNLPILLLLAAVAAIAQPKASTANLQIPSALKAKFDAMGTRFSTKGNERAILTGTMSRPGLPSVGAVISYEIPRQFRYQEASKALVHDGEREVGPGSLSDADGGLMESLLEDSMDGLLYTMDRAQLFRPLMNRARLDDGKAANYSGPYVDIYEIALPIPSRGNLLRRKHFYFDSKTLLLDRVVYYSGNVRVETRFQDWRVVNGSPTPGTISRSENGVNKFSFSSQQVSIGAAQVDRTFQP